MKLKALALMLFLSIPIATATAAPIQGADKGQVVKADEVQRVITEYLQQRTSGLKAQVKVKKVSPLADLQLPTGRVTYEVIAPARWEGYGQASVALIVRVDDQVKRNQTVMVDVEALAEMVIATRSLGVGEILTREDLAYASRNLAQVQGRFATDSESLVGLRVKMAIKANSPVRTDFVERAPVIKSGQAVTIIAENDLLRFTATGKAKTAGAVGDVIKVQNVSSNKDIAARVVDATTVAVEF